MKLILSILTLIPFVGPIVYLLLEKPTAKNERLITLLAIIPFLNLVCAIFLILNALGIIKLG